MSHIFTLLSRSSVLSVDLYNATKLNPQYDYSLALIGLHTYNSIPNIEEGVNSKFYYWELDDKTNERVINIPAEKNNTQCHNAAVNAAIIFHLSLTLNR